MLFICLLCALAFSAANGGQETAAQDLLDNIASTVINDMVGTLESKDVMTIDAALRSATAKVQPLLRELAKLKKMTIQQVAKLVSWQVAKDKRLLQSLAKRQGKVATRSSRSFSNYVLALVYDGLTSNLSNKQ